MKSEKSKLDRIKEHIKKGNEIHLEETAYLVEELGEFGTGSGFELGDIPFPKRAETEKEYRELALFESIRQFWSDAGECYMHRRFRGCTILLACLVEAVICLELSRKGKPYPKDSTLGQLIGYCEREKILSEILNDTKSVNELRKIALHLIFEKTKPKEIFYSRVFDEIVPLEKFKNPPVKIEKGWIAGDDVEVVIIPGCAIKYRYKKLAKAMYNHVQSILVTLYDMKFKFKFERLDINL